MAAETGAWLRFSVHERCFALPLEAVAEVANAPSPHLIPLVPRELGGVVNFRGEPLPALYASGLLSAEPRGRRRHLVVLDGGRLRVGLLVSEVVRIERGMERAVPFADPEPAPPDFVRWVRLGGELIGLIPPQELLERARKLLTEQRIEGGTMPWHDAF
jgi:chemotaxis signal transduction protein